MQTNSAEPAKQTELNIQREAQATAIGQPLPSLPNEQSDSSVNKQGDQSTSDLIAKQIEGMGRFSVRLKKLLDLKFKGNQSELARQIGITPQAVSLWIADEKKPSDTMLPALCKALDCTPAYLIMGIGDAPPLLSSAPSDAVDYSLDECFLVDSPKKAPKSASASHGTPNAVEVPEAFKQLITKIPAIEKGWPEQERLQWLEAFEAMSRVFYANSGALSMQPTGKAPCNTQGSEI